MKPVFPSLLCLVACAPALAADPLQTAEAGERVQQRRAELRQVISSHGVRPPDATDAPVRTLSERERAELREQLRRESQAPRQGAGGPREPRIARP